MKRLILVVAVVLCGCVQEPSQQPAASSADIESLRNEVSSLRNELDAVRNEVNEARLTDLWDKALYIEKHFGDDILSNNRNIEKLEKAVYNPK